MPVSRLKFISKVGVEQMGDLADSLDELGDFDLIPPHGGWSLLIDVNTLGMDGAIASKRLLERGNIAATAMVNWGSENSSRYLRVVFSNEPVARLRGIGQRFRQALG